MSNSGPPLEILPNDQLLASWAHLSNSQVEAAIKEAEETLAIRKRVLELRSQVQ